MGKGYLAVLATGELAEATFGWTSSPRSGNTASPGLHEVGPSVRTGKRRQRSPGLRPLSRAGGGLHVVPRDDRDGAQAHQIRAHAQWMGHSHRGRQRSTARTRAFTSTSWTPGVDLRPWKQLPPAAPGSPLRGDRAANNRVPGNIQCAHAARYGRLLHAPRPRCAALASAPHDDADGCAKGRPQGGHAGLKRER